ncbi:MAG: TonB family protein [Comamonadaceae bacterium]|nr:TonB family protein [Comamonadaceae bacterium]
MTPGPRPALVLALSALAGALLMPAQPAAAQQEPAKADGMARAQKAADAVFHWIKLHADKPAPKPSPAPAPAPAPKKPAPAPVAAAPRPAAPPVAASAAVAAPVTAAATPEPEPDHVPVVLAAAPPTPQPAAPMAAAAQAVEPPPQAAPEAPEEQLQLLSKVDPTLPRQLQQSNFRNGFAQVQFTVAPDGSVRQASVIKASHARLGNAAMDAVRQWRFAPLRKARDAAVEIAFKNDSDSD